MAEKAAAFADHFSTQAALYAARRPRYPSSLFNWLSAQAPGNQLCWDAGCGNGQAALALAERFERVIASDPSAAQIAEAQPHPRVEYRVSAAESTELAEASVDLICIAQAMHWFDPQRFHPLARRALKPNGVIAAISYGLCRVSEPIDALYQELYEGILGPYWPAERVHVESGYRSLPFPWDEPFELPPFEMQPRWTLAAYLGYLGSWSATQRYVKERQEDPVSRVSERLAAAWGDPEQERPVSFPLNLRVGRKSD